MGFQYRKAIGAGASELVAKDYKLDATYAATAKKGDVVRLNASGELVQAATGDTTVLGVLDGTNFEGLNKAAKVGKVITSPNAVYEATFVGGGALTPGVAYGLDGSSNVDTADTTVTIVKIVEVVKGKPYVTITARQL